MYRCTCIVLNVLVAPAAALAHVVPLPDYPFNGASAYDLFGSSVSNAGDVGPAAQQATP